MNSIVFKDLTILHICKPRLKNSYISIGRDSVITLKTSRVSKRYIDELLEEKEGWIRQKLLKQKENPPIKVNIEDEVLLFGEIYSVDSVEATLLRESLSRLRKPTQVNILRCYNNYYKLYADEYLRKQVEHYSNLMNLDYKEIKYKKMKRRWGSCSSLGVITLNTQLLKLKKEHIDYVVVHELAHLVHMNHSKKFHSLVQDYIVDATKIKKEMGNLTII